MTKTFFIPIEVQKREFHGKCLLAALSALQGYQVVFGWDIEIFSLFDHAQGTGQKLPGLLLYNGLVDAEYPSLYRYRQAGAAILAMPEEQLMPPFIPDSQNPYAPVDWKISERTLALAHRVLFWGPELAQRFIDYLPQVSAKAENVGSLAYDLLREPFLSVHSREAAAVKERHGSFILMLPQPRCSFAEDPKVTEFNQAQAKQYGYIAGNYYGEPANVEKQKIAFVTLVQKVHNAFPDKSIVIRPHPVDDPVFWKDLCAPYRNVSINNSGNAIPWFLAAEAMIQAGSSVGHQSLFLQQPQIYFGPLHTVDTTFLESVLFKDFFCRADDEVVALLQKYLTKGYQVDESIVKKLQGLYANLSGKSACERVLEVLAEVDWGKDVVNAKLPQFVEGGRSVNLAFPPGRLAKKFQGISVDDIQKQFDIHAEHIPDIRKVLIQQTGENVFILSTNCNDLSLRYTTPFAAKVWRKTKSMVKKLKRVLQN